MADSPEIQNAKQRLRDLANPAVDRLEGLLDSDHDGVRLGAVREVLDRAGVSAQHTITLEVGLDAEIEGLISAVRRQVDGRRAAAEGEDIEDAELVGEPEELPAGEQAAAFIGVPPDEVVPETEVAEVVSRAWWQANPLADTDEI